MKSLLVRDAFYIDENDKRNYSDLQVMKSNAGYYIGTVYIDPENGFEEPGSRDSRYFDSKEEAEQDFEKMKKFL